MVIHQTKKHLGQAPALASQRFVLGHHLWLFCFVLHGAIANSICFVFCWGLDLALGTSLPGGSYYKGLAVCAAELKFSVVRCHLAK